MAMKPEEVKRIARERILKRHPELASTFALEDLKKSLSENDTRNSDSRMEELRMQVLAEKLKTKGEKGDQGITPLYGVDYFTQEDIAKVKEGIKDGIKEDITPIKGVDYFDGLDGNDGKDGADGKDGKNGRDGVDGKDGNDGKDGENALPDNALVLASKLNTLKEAVEYSVLKNVPTVKELIAQMKALPLTDRLDISDIRNWNQPAKGKQDQRWHGGGSVSIGSSITGGSDGSVLFINPAGILAQDNANFSYSGSTDTLSVTNAHITGKLTVDGPIDPTYVEFTQIATPSTPASGKDRLYFKSDDKPYFKNSSGTETIIATGSAGTVTSVSVVTAQGVSGTVATATTTPAITLDLGALTGVTSLNGLVVTANTGVITTGTWNGTVIIGTYGGTGVNNGTKTLTYLKNISFTAADDTGVYTLPTGTKTLVATDVATLSSLTSVGTMTTGAISTGFVVAGVTMTLGSDASYDMYYRGATGVLTRLANGTNGQVLTATTSAAPSWSAPATSGTVTTVSVVSANGFAGTVANATTTPAITLTTSINSPVLSGNGTAISAATTTGSGSTVVLQGSPTLTTAVLGSSTATTQATSDNTTKVATTAFVTTAITNALNGLDWKPAVMYATTANVVGLNVAGVFTYTATGLDSIDGHTLVLNDVILFKNQTTQADNGVWVVTTAGAIGIAGVLTRRTDYNTAAEIQPGDAFYVLNGTVNAGTTWVETATVTTINTDPLTFSQSAGPGSFTAGNGISITGISIAIDTSVTVDKTTAQTLTNKTLTSPTLTAPALGTPASGVMTNVTGIPAAAILAGSFGAGAYVISTSLQVATLELGAATDTTLSRVSAGVIAVEGVTIVDVSSSQTLTNKSISGGQISSAVATATALATSRNLWGQGFTGAADVTGSLTAVGNITGGASSMTITAGTGNSRTMILQTTTSGGTATTALTLNADQSATFAGTVTAKNVITTPATVTVTSNAGTVAVANEVSNFTNSSASAMTITLATSGAVDGQVSIVRIFDASAATKGITWVNTENSANTTAPPTSAGSTTIPLTVGFRFNGGTSLWTCQAYS